MPPDEFYTELKLQITDEFSERGEFARYFGKRPKREPRVDSSDSAPSTPDGSGWKDLPPEAKSLGAEFISDGLFKNEAAYAKSYFEQE
jgi:hypothetical protein